ncbi:hypothetical protein LPYR103PRE_24410 [Segatella asaccharophila]
MIQLTTEQQKQVHDYRQRKEHEEMLCAARARIMQGIARNNNRSGERAIWELMQNACDLSVQAVTKIILTNNSITFAHQGEPFDLDTLSNLIKQQSTKREGDNNKVGQYGTGFMTTHVFNRKVHISGDCCINYKENNNSHKMYVPLPNDFCLDRSSDDEDIFIREMDNELLAVENLYSKEGNEKAGTWTSFCYTLTPETVEKVNNQLNITTRLMPFVMAFNDHIKECTIENTNDNTCTQYIKVSDRKILPLSYNNNICKVLTTIQVIKNDIKSDIIITTLETIDGNDRIVIPPLPTGFDETSKIPSQFLFFPMLGTEKFGTNFIFHSSRLFPTESRNSFLLPQDNDGLAIKYKHNKGVLDELINMLFAYYRNNIDQQNIPLDFANVNFKYDGEDPVTKAFYEKLQKMFSEEFVKWKMIPTEKGYLSIKDDNGFVVLDSSIYNDLDEEKFQKYIPIVTKYAAQIFTIPNKNIIEWSQVVNNWDPNNIQPYYAKLEKICDNIKIKDNDLHTFLLLLKELGETGINLLKSKALIPNRGGILKKSGELRDGKSITTELYDIAKPILGTRADKLVDTEYADIVALIEYTRTDLRDEIKSTIDNLRRLTFNYISDGINSPKLLEELNNTVTITNLVCYCSAFTSVESTSYRARLMPVICELYGIDYKPIVIPSIDNEEPDLYLSAFSFLVENTMLMLSHKPSLWLTSDEGHEQNHDLLLQFVQIFTDTKDEQRIKKLDDYGIVPNQLGEVNKVKDLKKNISIDDELQQLYNGIFKHDLKESFVDVDFSDLYPFIEYKPEDVGDEIEKQLKAINYDGTDILLIINHLNTKEDSWKSYFPNIYAQRKDLYYTHGNEEDKEALFRIQMQGSEKIKRMAELAESKNFDAIINKVEDLLHQQQERDRQFLFTFAIGKLIEDDIRNEVNSELTCSQSEISTDDVQYGQDMVIRYKGTPLYYIECKAKWNFNEPAHMSSLQIKQAVRESVHYALCCIDCTPETGCNVSPDATKEDVSAAHSDILNHTYVNVNIGTILSSTVKPVVQQEEDTSFNEDSNIKVYGDFKCNISKHIFIKGTIFCDFMQRLKLTLKDMVDKISSNA